MPPLGIGRLECEQAVEFTCQATAVHGDCGVGDVRAATADRTGVFQEQLELRREDRVAVVDAIACIADQVREAELMRLGVRALCGQPIRQPHLRFRAAEKRRRHAFSARRCDDVVDCGGAAERPLPPRLALHARTRLVRCDHGACAHFCCDEIGVGRERQADAREDVGDRALRDRHAEQAVQRFGQALETHQLAAVQIRNGRHDTETERRALGHVGGRCRRDAPLAARTRGSEQVDARRDGLDRRNIGVVVSARELLIGCLERCPACTALGLDVARDIGVRTELARDTGTAAARRLLRRLDIGLGRRRRRLRGIVRRFRRRAELGFEFGDVGVERGDLREEIVDASEQRRILRHDPKHHRLQVVVERIDLIGRHPELKSARAPALNTSRLSHAVAEPSRRGE